MTRRNQYDPFDRDPFKDPFFTEGFSRSRNETRSVRSTRAKGGTKSLNLGVVAATATGGVLAVLFVLGVVAFGLALIGALVGWLGMLALGIAGVHVPFLTVAWPIGVIVTAIVGILSKN